MNNDFPVPTMPVNPAFAHMGQSARALLGVFHNTAAHCKLRMFSANGYIIQPGIISLWLLALGTLPAGSRRRRATSNAQRPTFNRHPCMCICASAPENYRVHLSS
ncbi:hypothetical protein FA95DRAFT_126228 [Auriscalpium vulgare]|uniref:Uncharacterized protein n=1 Tax=Auriscalpium vulgare TaxID=40419 RepID=A0ACB8RNZ2_9AGAM|nr:hypothetical protein FA95DRAFT_126228 [Auriscalpium vulgare]